jgi:hypothetical protein
MLLKYSERNERCERIARYPDCPLEEKCPFDVIFVSNGDNEATFVMVAMHN